MGMNNTIFTTGAYVRPQIVIDEQGDEKWVWVIAEFIDDSFKDGVVFNPPEVADNHQELCKNLAYDMEEINHA